jgi:hypothetical protein
MAFDYTYPCIRGASTTRLTRDALAAKASELGLTRAYVIDAVELVPHRWRRQLVDVVVHVGYGDDLLDPQLPDDVHDVVMAALAALVRGT